jgi:ATP-dependent RNA helicase HelY
MRERSDDKRPRRYARPQGERYAARKRRQSRRVSTIRPGADPRLNSVFAGIGVPEEMPFRPDPFQLEALDAIQRADCLVTAPTGAGKTWIAKRAIEHTLERGGRSWYASPLKALSTAKLAEFAAEFGQENVGILTGDRKENADAPVIVGTTEILRNQLYDAMHVGEDLDTDLVVLDEAHFMGDPDRGVVWEEVMIYLPHSVSLLLLSATIGNADEIADWLETIREKRPIVVEATERPVELYPLFLHPSGTLLPLLSPESSKPRLDRKVRAYASAKNPPLLYDPRDLPPFGEILEVLRRYNLLPAIFFLKSRSDCDRALELSEGHRPRGTRRRERLRLRIEELVAESQHLANHPQLWHLRHLAVGAHHGGQLPPWKLVLETLMTEGLLDAVFATSTVAAGVNFPARSVVFVQSDRFDGHEFVPLTATEFHQMTGRAGRRGMDHIGFLTVVPGPFMDLELIAQLWASAPLGVPSQVQISFSMLLNLLLSHTPAEIEHLLRQSFAAYRQKRGRYEQLVRELERHLAFLRNQGYVTAGGLPTESGRWASLLRVDQPLLIAEALKRELLPDRDSAILAAIVASFVNEREADDNLRADLGPRALERAFVKTTRGLRPFATQMKRAGFETRPLYLRPAAAVYAWASEEPWQRAVAISEMADGDLTMLVSRTADNLRHIEALHSPFPAVSRAAGSAVDLIMRDPVMYG